MNPVHEEWHNILVKSSHGDNIFYRVFKGTVNWSRSSDGLLTAIVLFMQYGTTKNWEQAKANQEIDFKMPAHILHEDLELVSKAMKEIASM